MGIVILLEPNDSAARSGGAGSPTWVNTTNREAVRELSATAMP